MLHFVGGYPNLCIWRVPHVTHYLLTIYPCLVKWGEGRGKEGIWTSWNNFGHTLVGWWVVVGGSVFVVKNNFERSTAFFPLHFLSPSLSLSLRPISQKCNTLSCCLSFYLLASLCFLASFFFLPLPRPIVATQNLVIL